MGELLYEELIERRHSSLPSQQIIACLPKWRPRPGVPSQGQNREG